MIQDAQKNRDVIIDAIDTSENLIIARTSSDAPDIDGQVYIDIPAEWPDKGGVRVGDITQVTITDTDEYDMWGKFS